MPEKRDIFNDLKHAYNNMVPAQALYFHLRKYGLRIECPTIGKEFTDGVAIGTDPEGFLFYNDSEAYAFGDTFTTVYHISRLKNPADGRFVSHITFTLQGDKTPYAIFLAYDPANVTSTMGMINLTRKGHWQTLKLGTSTATVVKSPRSNVIRMKVDAFDMTATFHDTKGYFGTIKKTITSHGMFNFKHYKDIKDGVIAGYDRDRIVFYGRHGRDFKGYFIPFEYSQSSLIKNNLGNVNAEFKNVKWT